MSSQQPTLTQRVFSAAAWNTLLFPARFVVGLVASVLLFNYLSLTEFGILTLLTGLAATIGVYADLGIERSLPRFLPEIESQSGRRGVAAWLPHAKSSMRLQTAIISISCGRAALQMHSAVAPLPPFSLRSLIR
jgi:O-antigen/teichoic acid export membrane protein